MDTPATFKPCRAGVAIERPPVDYASCRSCGKSVPVTIIGPGGMCLDCHVPAWEVPPEMPEEDRAPTLGDLVAALKLLANPHNYRQDEKGKLTRWHPTGEPYRIARKALGMPLDKEA